ncbi:MAG: 2-oxo acid dehydrogenase subunit E2 [Bacteroidales bacterium]|jgi:pyruvate/2-oxoglutarate dehydrogenase complex dihydrolipoamide acyltransferase (E2) component|nr:2-oxo acid dehydrogenase subunit E2 [Bacteroidales bacterium]
MDSPFSIQKIPRSRIATFDIFSIGLEKHHVAGLLEFDVTGSRKKLQDLRKQGINISFNGWLVKVIGSVLKQYPEAAAYRQGKGKLVVYKDINISILVEKNIGGKKVPIPLVIEKAGEKSAEQITAEIEDAKRQELTGKSMVLKRDTTFSEGLYYLLPGFLRRLVWRIMLGSPAFAYRKMGNAVVTSIGMAGRINGWFIHKSVHPVSFGVGSVLQKPVVVDKEVKVRDILNMTILVDHDVIDGAPMVRLLNELTKAIESGEFIPSP